MRLLILLIFLWLSSDVVTTVKMQSTRKSVIERLEDFGMKYPKVFLCQVYLETGNLKSAIFQENKNLVGMKLPRIRPTLAIGENRGHAVYITAADSITDYILWQQAFSRGISECSSDEEYIDYISTFYAEDPNYARKLRSIYKESFKKQSLTI